MRSKKGSWFVPLIVFGALMILISLIAILFVKKANLEATFGSAIGEKEVELMRAYQSGEVYLQLVDGSANKAMGEASVEIASKGLTKGGGCGDINGYQLWAMKDAGLETDCAIQTPPCEPSDIGTFFKDTFQGKFYSILDSYNQNRKEPFAAEIPKDYSFSLDSSNSRIVGRSGKPIVISESSSEETGARLVYNYSVMPSFNQPLGVSFTSDASSILSTARRIIGKDEKEARAIVSATDGDGFDWDEEFPYESKEESCPKKSGTCSCCETVLTCEEHDETGDCIKEGKTSVPTDDGILYTIIPQDRITAKMSVKIRDDASSTGNKLYFIYDSASKRVVPTEVEYRFGLEWVSQQPEESTTLCQCSKGIPC